MTVTMSQKSTIVERDSTGLVLRSYILSTQDEDKSVHCTRLDPVPVKSKSPASWLNTPRSAKSLLGLPLVLLSQYLLPVFLPHGYPHTVTPDYTPYQIYDSLQAFASTIAGLLSSRAVLQSLGVDDQKSSTNMATYATLLSIAQATFSNLSTILFAHYASQRISNDVKFYRFLADIVNDAALLIDCLSPSLPRHLRAAALCTSSMFRAVCGVAGGSSKALLSSHFALTGNVGELNAKDSSQETVINLLGMWVGGVVVSRVVSAWATWAWMLGLLTLHLWFNYRAVRCIILSSLNGYRTGKVIGELYRSGRCPRTEEIARDEGVFSRTDVLVNGENVILGRIKIGISTTSFLQTLGGNKQPSSGAWVMKHQLFQQCAQIMHNEKYLLWFDVRSKEALMLLKEHATIDDQLQGWYHATCIAALAARETPNASNQMLDVISQTLAQSKLQWHEHRGKVMAAGWDLMRSGTESQPGIRVSIP